MGGFLGVVVLGFRCKLIQNFGEETESFTRAYVFVRVRISRHGKTACGMETRGRADLVGGRARLWRSRAPCDAYGQAQARRRSCGRPPRRRCRSCAAPASENADRDTMDAARRRLGVIREVLQTLTTPQFGRRQSRREGADAGGESSAALGIAARLPPVRCRNPPGLQASGQARAPGRRRQCAGVSGAVRGAGRADEGAVKPGARYFSASKQMVGTARMALVPTPSADRSLSALAGALAHLAFPGDQRGQGLSISGARSGSNRRCAANGRREQGALGVAASAVFVARRRKSVPPGSGYCR